MKTKKIQFSRSFALVIMVIFGLAGCTNISQLLNGVKKGHNSSWEYSGAYGPEHWGKLDEAFAVCDSGKNQSPINITKTIEANLAPLSLNFSKPATEILNNGHTVQLNFAENSGFKLKGQEFELKQLHFHTPSENIINGKSYPLEGHFVHADKNGQLAVIGVLFEEGRSNSGLAKALQQLPKTNGEKYALTSEIYPRAMLPRDMAYYRFNGSLTTPPCSEGVLWLLMKQPIMASTAQLQAFESLFSQGNNRPVQQINARGILK